MFHFRPALFHRLACRTAFPFHLLRRPGVLWRLLFPLVRHPRTAVRNLLASRERGRDSFAGVCLGAPDREAFINRLQGEIDAWRAGQRPAKPRLVWLQAYCQKLLTCVCGQGPLSAAGLPQRRFNGECFLENRRESALCGGSRPCRLGRLRRELAGEWENLTVQAVTMLDEDQMSRHWADAMAEQAREGQATPFVMEICPFSLWIADQALFRLRTPLGVVFFLDEKATCRTYRQYLAADAGRKTPATAVPLDPAAARDLADFAARIAALAGRRGAPVP